MWTVIYVAQTKNGALNLKNILAEQGVYVKIRQFSKTKKEDGLYEILVPETEIEDACYILEQYPREF